MENIAPVRALNRRSTQLLQMGFIVLAIGILLTVVGRITDHYPPHPPYSSSILVI